MKRLVAVILLVALTGCASDPAVRRESRWMYGSVIADTSITMHAVSNGATEQNPFLRQASENPAVFAAVMLGVGAFFEWQASRMKAQGNPYWHWPLRVKTIVHSAAFGWNGYQTYLYETRK